MTINIHRDKNTREKTVKVNGTKATLYTFDQDIPGDLPSCLLIWSKGNILYRINGNVSSEDMIKIAESLK